MGTGFTMMLWVLSRGVAWAGAARGRSRAAVRAVRMAGFFMRIPPVRAADAPGESRLMLLGGLAELTVVPPA
ncbi:hypothetical protein DAETH_30120 [Deinococcus aetherius]|uniref:Uncharacterized protein n=1 Tax=Deinococcus aetherius TaxID=200252 RepID=A0ABM8AGW7_9DEIO|nr:hypothetical protein DAETH_30120 [Deinococcus aetherius]